MSALIFGVVIGLLLPIQTCMNSRLREAVGSPYLSSLGSFTGGTLFLAVLALIIEGTFLFSLDDVAHQPAWIWLGGLFGMIGLTANILIFPRLGGVQTTVLPICGQILMGLIIDHFGLFEAHQTLLTPARLAGAVLVLCGVIGAVTLGGKRLFSSKSVQSVASESEATTGSAALAPTPKNVQPVVTTAETGLWGWRLLALSTGFLMASQSAINGHLGVLVGSPVKAALVSFTMGTILLFLLALALRLKFRLRVPSGKKSNPRWMWFGGILGGTFVFGNALLVPILGTGLTVVAALVGMVSGSLLVDKFGLLQAVRRPVSLAQVLSLLLMMVGVVFIRLV